MTGWFRGFKEVEDTVKPVEGIGILFSNHKAYVLKENSDNPITFAKTQVIPASVSPSVYVQSLGHVFAGDIIKYTFKHKKEYYTRYYQIVEHDNLIKLMELYRDYEIAEDLTVTRGKFYNFRGEYRALDTSMPYDHTYTVVGNIWQNPEYGRL